MSFGYFRTGQFLLHFSICLKIHYQGSHLSAWNYRKRGRREGGPKAESKSELLPEPSIIFTAGGSKASFLCFLGTMIYSINIVSGTPQGHSLFKNRSPPLLWGCIEHPQEIPEAVDTWNPIHTAFVLPIQTYSQAWLTN